MFALLSRLGVLRRFPSPGFAETAGGSAHRCPVPSLSARRAVSSRGLVQWQDSPEAV